MLLAGQDDDPPFYGIFSLGDNVWSINGSKALHRNNDALKALWTEANGDHFAIADLNEDQKLDRPPLHYESDFDLAGQPEFALFKVAAHKLGRAHVWSIGSGAYLKIRTLYRNSTRESDTIRAVQERNWSLSTPEVFFDWEDDTFDYTLLQAIPGRTLASAWPKLENWQQQFYHEQIAKYYAEMAEWKNPRIEGVDGKQLPECTIFYSYPKDYSHERLCSIFAAFGLDIENLVFQHLDMHPGNIIVADSFCHDKPTIIDWELAGFAPKEWVLTKAYICPDFGDNDRRIDMHEWMTLAGFAERADQYVEYERQEREARRLRKEARRLAKTA